MDLIKELHEYHKKPNYAAGIALVEKYHPVASLVKLLKSGENSFTRKKLQEALEQLKPRTAEQQRKEPASKHQDNPILGELESKRKLLFLNTASMHGALLYVDSHAKRFELAKKILENRKEMADLWAKHDYVLKFGKLPDEEKPLPEGLLVADFMRQYENARINLQKVKKRLLNADQANKSKIEMLVNKYETIMKELENIKTNGRIIIS